MIDELKPYPCNKDSGAPWLGDVPEHWDVLRLKNVCRRSALYGANIPASSYSPDGVRFLRTTDIRADGSLKLGGVYVPPEDVADYILQDGDLLISRSGTVGRSFLYASETHGPCGYAGYLVRFVPGPGVLPKYLLYFTRTTSFMDFLKLASIQSTIENVNGAKYADSAISLPPLDEQASIVKFLGYADRRIRRYIHAKQKLVKLLEEQKQAVIHRAVTHGLDPNVRLKPSGLPWLGDVPATWGVLRMRNAADMWVSNVDKLTKEEELAVRLCNYVDVYKNDRITFRLDFMRATATTEEVRRFRLRTGDVLITKDSEDWKDIGVPSLVEEAADDLVCGYHLAMLRPRVGLLDSSYLFRALQSPSVARQFQIAANGVTRYGLSQEAIKSILLPIPSLDEQSEIVRYIDKATANLTVAIEHAQSEVSLLSEYQSRLITDLVTGKLDVREAAANLPDEISEEEAILDDSDSLLEDVLEDSDSGLEASLEEVEA